MQARGAKSRLWAKVAKYEAVRAARKQIESLKSSPPINYGIPDYREDWGFQVTI